MTDPQNTAAGFARLIQLWTIQLRRTTGGLTGVAGLSESVLAQSVQSLQGLPHPGARSAAQLNLIASSVASQRQGIAATQASCGCSTSSWRSWSRSSARSPSGARRGHSSRGWCCPSAVTRGLRAIADRGPPVDGTRPGEVIHFPQGIEPSLFRRRSRSGWRAGTACSAVAALDGFVASAGETFGSLRQGETIRARAGEAVFRWSRTEATWRPAAAARTVAAG